MDYEYLDRFMVHFVAGAGMLLVGGLNLVLARLGCGWQLAASFAGAGSVVGGAAWAFNTTSFLATASAILVPTILAYHLLGSGYVRRTFSRAAEFVAQPLVRSAILCVAGLAVVTASAVTSERAEQEYLDRELDEMTEALGYAPPLGPQTDFQATTDRGQPIPLKKPLESRDAEAMNREEQRVLKRTTLQNQFVHRQPADDQCNCHGWVFAAGQAWVTGDTVPQILNDNGYFQVAEPQVGDVVIYRQNGAVAHTGIVRAVIANDPPIVESKWGWMGLFLHPANQSYYGPEYSYYRSTRTSHVLQGIDLNATTPRLRSR